MSYHPFYTHQKYLRNELENLDFSKKIHILEFGSGIGSGDIFKEYTDKYPDNLIVECFEHETEWFNECNKNYGKTNYLFHLIKWEEFDYNKILDKKYDLIFVDQGIWSERARTVEELSKNNDLFIVHDFDFFNKNDSGYINGCYNIYGTDDSTYWGNKYNNEFNLESYCEFLPPTLVLKRKV